MKIIVLSYVKYKEKDCIIDAICETGPISFLLRGGLNSTSKNKGLLNNLVVADVDFQEGSYKYPILKSSSIIQSSLKIDASLDFLAVTLIINELTKNLVQDEEKSAMFPILFEALNILNRSNNSLLILLIYIGKILKITGYEFEINKCVFCGNKKNIKAFSFIDGGFVCENCLDKNTDISLTSEQMLLLRETLLTNSFDFNSELFSKDNALAIIKKYDEFIADSYGVRIKNLNLLY